jgi:hypothetical protein
MLKENKFYIITKFHGGWYGSLIGDENIIIEPTKYTVIDSNYCKVRKVE